MILVPVDVPVKFELPDNAVPPLSAHGVPIRSHRPDHSHEASGDDPWSSPDDATLERMAEDARFAGMLDAGQLPF